MTALATIINDTPSGKARSMMLGVYVKIATVLYSSAVVDFTDREMLSFFCVCLCYSEVSPNFSDKKNKLSPVS